MIRAGTPPTMPDGGTSLLTTAPAATTAPWPTVTPSSTTAFAPIQTSSSMVMPRLSCACAWIGTAGSSKPWLKPTIEAWLAIRTPSPQRTLPEIIA